MIAVSACLGGVCCRYDGQAKCDKRLTQWVENKHTVLICPEVLAGLSVPRVPAEIVGGVGDDVWHGRAKVIDKCGNDVTEAFKLGAIRTYERLNTCSVTTIILKERSPSCGSTVIYDGTFSGKVRQGSGVTTAYLIKQGLQVFSEANWFLYGMIK